MATTTSKVGEDAAGRRACGAHHEHALCRSTKPCSVSPTMTANNVKALPPLPHAMLSIDARAHRAALIHHLLADVPGNSIPQRHYHACVHAIQDALDCFSDGLARGNWLAGIRKSIPGAARAAPEDSVLEQLRGCLAHPASSDSVDCHLLLCLAPPAQDHALDIACTFTADKFILPSDAHQIETSVLFGLQECRDRTRCVGGTFSFKGLPQHHYTLAQILRVSIYIHISLLLEQHLLSDSHVDLIYPSPKVEDPDGEEEDFEEESSYSQPQPNPRSPFIPLPPGILSFFSRKKRQGLFHRAQTIGQFESRSSLDSVFNVEEREEESSSSDHGGATSFPTKLSSRWTRFSFGGLAGGENRRRDSLRRITSTTPAASPTSPPPPTLPSSSQQPPQFEGPFSSALNLLNTSKSLLSTSVGVTFLPPNLLIDLAKKERESPNRRLKGNEKAALVGILGWTGTGSGFTGVVRKDGTGEIRDGPGNGMTGLTGFVRHQGLQVLASRHVPSKKKELRPAQPPTRPSTPTPTASSGLSTTSTTTLASTPTTTDVTSTTSTVSSDAPYTVYRGPLSSSAELTNTVCCGRPRWHTYRYFSFSNPPDHPSSSLSHTYIPPHPPPISTSFNIPSISHPNLNRSGSTNNASGENVRDRRLGEIIYEMIRDANSPCTTTTTTGGGGCGYKNGEHELRIVHAGIRVSINVSGYEEFGQREQDKRSKREKEESSEHKENEDQIEMWQSCKICQKETARIEMSDGTFLFSYAKFLEVLIYSSSIYGLSPDLCEHTISPPPPPPSPTSPQTQNQPQTQQSTTTTGTSKYMPMVPQNRTNLIRHFGISNATVSFSISRVEDIFELKVPRLQIHFGGGSAGDDDENDENDRMKFRTRGKVMEEEEESEKKEILRSEIRNWYKGVFNHLSKLEHVLATLTADDDSASSTGTPTPSASSAVKVGEGNKELPTLPPSESEIGNRDDVRNDWLEEVMNTTPKASTKGLPVIQLETSTNERSVEKESQGGEVVIDARPPSRMDDGDSGRKDQNHTSDSTESTPSSTTIATSISKLLTPTPSTLSLSSTLSSAAISEECLQNLRSSFLRTEEALYSQLQQTRIEILNDVRRNFHSSAKGLMKRLRAWQKKHLLRLAAGSESGSSKKFGERKKKLLIGLLKEAFGVEGTTTTMGLKELVEILPKCEEPEWWNSVCHVVPASNMVVREDDWGSLIAFTLSSMDYHRELANLTNGRASISSPPAHAPEGSSSTAPTTSFFNTSKLFGGSSTPNNQPDPDRDDIIWHEPESYSAVISRKEHPREYPSSLLSIREVLRHKSPALADYPGLGGSGSGVGGASTPPLTQRPRSPGISDTAATTVYAKPDVKVSRQAVGGEVSSGGGTSSNLATIAAVSAAAAAALAAEKKMGKKKNESSGASEKQVSSLSGKLQPGNAAYHAAKAIEATTTSGGRGTRDPSLSTTTISDWTQRRGSPPTSESQMSTTGSSCIVDTHIKRGKTEPFLSIVSSDEMNIVDDGERGKGTVKRAPTPPPKDKGPVEGKLLYSPSFAAMKELPTTPTSNSIIHQPTPSTSSITDAIANSLNMAMRFMSIHSSSDPLPSSPSTHPLPQPPPPVPKKQHQHHNLLLVDLNQIDERPHIKYDWTIGKRLKFSCTVYYAKQFELLRKRCGIDDTFLKSLERCVHWVAEGGKSKSNFWKTMDEKFIIKTLVDAWNVADLQVLLELGPAYFRYVESTASRATILAKLVGFYTIEIRNLETGAVQSKADLLVMENLFYHRKISQIFDLKGIQGRKVKAKHSGKHQNSKTLFDGEWIEGQQKALILLQPRSKSVLKEAIRSDADFLAKSNIMDYSLLLGIDQEKKQIACGLVDTIGSYTFAKTLEYKAKHNLHSGKNVTVIPPAEYQERFVNALEDYFLACPDKWSKPLDDSKIISDPFLLPSVL